MFDVVWANPERELVGQRKARKDKERERREGCSSGGRSVASAETESSGRRRKPQSFLSSIRLRSKRSKQDTTSLAGSSRLSVSSAATANRDSVAAPPSLTTSSLGRSEDVPYSDASAPKDRFLDSSSSQARSSQDADSILSKWTLPNSLATMLSLDKDIELELQAKERQTVLLQPQAEVQPSLQSPRTPRSRPSTRDRPRTATLPRVLSAKVTGRPKDAFVAPRIRPLSAHSSSVSSWPTADSWESSNLSPPAPLMLGRTEASIRSASTASTADTPRSAALAHEDELMSLSLNLSGIQREVLQMAAAGPETVWKRLTEEWAALPDAALYKELEMERKRWLLSALYSINPAPDSRADRMAVVDRQILAFFETPATASYIAALNAGVPVHHMSPAPLSNKLFPNVAPILSTSSPCASLSAAPPVFSDFYAQSLPVLVSASNIPPLLRSMHRVLRPHGTLHLLLMDPCPARAATGPRLQAWLDEHLLLNLERQFRCTSPTRLFPAWLRDAHFQLSPGARVVCRFAAVIGDGDGDGDDGDGHCSGHDEDNDNKDGDASAGTTPVPAATAASEPQPAQSGRQRRRLHSLVGQKLWQEIWGRYVTADRWWWEDRDCREECLRMNTTWEYHIVEAVKKDRYLASQL